jgi:mono/diheme cytochrome c family protein
MMRAAALVILCVLAAGCTRSNMDDQPKYHEYEPAPLFTDGRVLQAPVAGTIARDARAQTAEAQKPPLTAALLARGHAQFDVFCAPCHDRVGTGDGIVVQRGFPRPASFHDERLRTVDDQHFIDAIVKGYGTMYAFADRVQPRDRWALVAYIRALQLSQHAGLDDVPADKRPDLEAAP